MGGEDSRGEGETEHGVVGTMMCGNPACTNDTFTVMVEKGYFRQNVKEIPFGRLPMKLTCTRCKKPQKIWATNEQLGVLGELLDEMSKNMGTMARIISTPIERMGIIDRIKGLFR